MPNNPEVEMLREALEAALGYINTSSVTYMGEQYEEQRKLQSQYREFVIHGGIQAALAAPVPKQKLRPMSEAPRDGRKLLAYALDRSPVIVWVNRGEEAVWTHSDGTIAPKWLLGYLPLPDVEL